MCVNFVENLPADSELTCIVLARLLSARQGCHGRTKCHLLLYVRFTGIFAEFVDTDECYTVQGQVLQGMVSIARPRRP